MTNRNTNSGKNKAFHESRSWESTMRKLNNELSKQERAQRLRKRKGEDEGEG